MSFRFQINLLFILLLSAIGLGSLLFFKHEQEKVIQINLQEQADAIGELVAPDLAKLIYMDDPDVAADITQRIKNIGSIYAVYFFDPQHQPILNVQPKHLRTIDSAIGIHATLNYQSMLLGEAHFIFVSDCLNWKTKFHSDLFSFPWLCYRILNLSVRVLHRQTLYYATVLSQ